MGALGGGGHFGQASGSGKRATVIYSAQEHVIDGYLESVHCIQGEGKEIIRILDDAGYVIVPKTATAEMLEAGPPGPYMDQEVWLKMLNAHYLKDLGIGA
jgi:hypothetical protein